MKVTLLAFAVWIAGIPVSYGYLYADAYQIQKASFPNLGEAVWQSGAALDAGAPAIVWPIALPGHYFAKEWTK